MSNPWPAGLFQNYQYNQFNCYIIYGELTFREIVIQCLFSCKLILLHHMEIVSFHIFDIVTFISFPHNGVRASKVVSNKLGWTGRQLNCLAHTLSVREI